MKIKVHSYNFDKLIEESPILLGVLNLNWKIEKVNDSWTDMLDYSEKELVNKNFIDLLFDRSDLEIINIILKEHKVLKAYNIHLVGKKGNPCWLKCSISFDGNKIIFIGINVTRDNFTKEILTKVSNITHIAGWSYNPKTEKLYWSPEFRKILETSYDTEVTKYSIKSFIHPYYLKEYEEATANLFENKIGYNIIVKCITEKQNNKWIQILSYPETVNNEIMHVQGILKDVTDTQSNLVEMKEIKETMQMALKGMKSGYFVRDFITGNYSYSESFKNVIGLKENIITALDFKKLVHPDDVEASYQRLIEDLEKKENHYFNFFRVKNSDNSYRHYEVYGWKIRDETGKVIKLIGNLIDVNDRIISERKTKIYHNQIKTLLNNGMMSSILLDKEGMILTADDKMVKTIMYEFNINVLETPTHFTDIVLEREKEAFKNEFIKLKKGETIKKEFSYINAEGDHKWYDAVFTPVLNAQNDIEGYVMNYVNMTEKKLEIEELKKLKDLSS